ncbi:MAG TPA: uroporphyrinogen decarboxylase family protein [Phycisphaerae bacterium]|nr:uroporphyrinogen decarboxylase family protein [Phycisphaerae bacterium]HUT56969.1 uroporphyrinogen decarboxylase family protein [Phycisphaerae bacterium]
MNSNRREAELSHRRRVRLALERGQTDRVPIAMVCSGLNPPVERAVRRHLKAARGLSLEEYLDPLIDIKAVWPPEVGPPRPPDTDIWGVRRKRVSYGPGEYMEIDHYPLAQADDAGDLDAHAWPSADWFDYSALSQQVRAERRQGDHCLMAMNGNPFETSWYMRGLERMMIDLVDKPELAREVLRRVTDFYVEYFRRILSAAEGEIDLVFTADDIGGQQGLLVSLEMWAEFIKPCHERINKAVHEFGARVIYHSDGAVMQAVPGLIDMGIDVLQALQFDARGMDPAVLQERYGERLCFCGGVSVQRTLPFGTVEDVREEVRRRIAVLGAGGGYILGPSHAVQAGTPPENVLAMFDTAAETPVPPA